MAQLDDVKLTLAQSWDDACDFKQWLGQRRDWLGLDIETTGLNVGKDRVRLCQFGDHEQGWAFSWEDWRGLCKEVIEGYDRPMVAHNLLFEAKMLKKDGVVIPERIAHDTMIMAFLDSPNLAQGLKPAASRLVDKRAGYGAKLLDQVMAAGRWTWETIPVDHPVYWQYGILDTVLTSLLASRLWPTTGGGQYKRAYDLELAHIFCLRDAEIAGMMTDPDYRRRAAAQLEYDLAALKPQIPIEGNITDTKVRDYLLALGAPLFVRTEHGQLSVDKHVLKWLEPTYPVAGLISTYRSKMRMLTNYFHKLDELEVDGAVHASTKPTGARTGRQSVTDPPLQTLPRGRVVRDAFVAREGHVMIGADFKGMEMRALAALAPEPAMLEAFARGEDLHDFVAREVYGPNFTKLHRQVCKSAGFAKIYGAGLEQFAVTAGIDVATAQDFLERYDVLFPNVAVHMQEIITQVHDRARGSGRYGWVDLVDGRRLPVEADKAYVGVNYEIQGSCAVSAKERIVALCDSGLGDYFRLSVHDEVIFEVPIEDAADARATIEEVMPDRWNFPGVVLEVDTDVYDRWGQHYRGDYPAYVPTQDPEWLEAA